MLDICLDLTGGEDDNTFLLLLSKYFLILE